MNNGEISPGLFRGHVEECLQHLAEAFATKFPKHTRGCSKAREPIVQFCGVAAHSIKTWFEGKVPRGQPLFKLMCLLELAGYKVIELDRLPKASRGIVELIGFGLFTGEQLAELLGFYRFSHLSLVLQGRSGLSQDKEQKMWEFLKSHKEELQRRKDEAAKKYRLDLRVQEMLSETSTCEPMVAERERNNLVQPASRTQGAIIGAVDMLLALLDDSSIAEFSQSDLANQPSVSQKILHLSALMSDLNYRIGARKQRTEAAHDT